MTRLPKNKQRTVAFLFEIFHAGYDEETIAYWQIHLFIFLLHRCSYFALFLDIVRMIYVSSCTMRGRLVEKIYTNVYLLLGEYIDPAGCVDKKYDHE